VTLVVLCAAKKQTPPPFLCRLCACCQKDCCSIKSPWWHK